MCYQLHKPDSVTPPKRCCYHLSTTAIADCLHLPTLERLAGGEVRRAAFIHSYTWHFSIQGLPTAGLATNHRELLPPVFTLTRPPYPRRGMNSKAVIFCGTVSTCQLLPIVIGRSIADVPPLAGWVALRCPDFPLLPCSSSDSLH